MAVGTRWVSVDGTCRHRSTMPFSLPPFSFVKPIAVAPSFFARLTASSTFAELPLVEIAITASPLRQYASTCRENVYW